MSRYRNEDEVDNRALPSFGSSEIYNAKIQMDVIRPQWEKGPLLFVPMREVYFRDELLDPDDEKSKVIKVPMFRKPFKEADVRGSMSEWIVKAPCVSWLGFAEDQGGDGQVSFIPYWPWEKEDRAKQNPYFLLTNFMQSQIREEERAKKDQREPKYVRGWDPKFAALRKGSHGRGAVIPGIANHIFMQAAVFANDRMDFVQGKGLQKTRFSERKGGSPLGAGKDDSLVVVELGTSLWSAVLRRFWKADGTDYVANNQEGVFGKYTVDITDDGQVKMKIEGGHVWCVFTTSTHADSIEGLIGPLSSVRSIEDIDAKDFTKNYGLATLPEFAMSRDMVIDGSFGHGELSRLTSRLRPFFPPDGEDNNPNCVLIRHEYEWQAEQIARVLRKIGKVLRLAWDNTDYLTADVEKILNSARSVSKPGDDDDGGESDRPRSRRDSDDDGERPARSRRTDDDGERPSRRRTDDEDQPRSRRTDDEDQPRSRRDVVAPPADPPRRRPSGDDDGGEDRPPGARTRPPADDPPADAPRSAGRSTREADDDDVPPREPRFAEISDDPDDEPATGTEKPKRRKAADKTAEGGDPPADKPSRSRKSRTEEPSGNDEKGEERPQPRASTKSSTETADPPSTPSDEGDSLQDAAAAVAKTPGNGGKSKGGDEPPPAEKKPARRRLIDDDE